MAHARSRRMRRTRPRSRGCTVRAHRACAVLGALRPRLRRGVARRSSLKGKARVAPQVSRGTRPRFARQRTHRGGFGAVIGGLGRGNAKDSVFVREIGGCTTAWAEILGPEIRHFGAQSRRGGPRNYSGDGQSCQHTRHIHPPMPLSHCDCPLIGRRDPAPAVPPAGTPIPLYTKTIFPPADKRHPLGNRTARPAHSPRLPVSQSSRLSRSIRNRSLVRAYQPRPCIRPISRIFSVAT